MRHYHLQGNLTLCPHTFCNVIFYGAFVGSILLIRFIIFSNLASPLCKCELNRSIWSCVKWTKYQIKRKFNGKKSVKFSLILYIIYIVKANVSFRQILNYTNCSIWIRIFRPNNQQNYYFFCS